MKIFEDFDWGAILAVTAVVFAFVAPTFTLIKRKSGGRFEKFWRMLITAGPWIVALFALANHFVSKHDASVQQGKIENANFVATEADKRASNLEREIVALKAPWDLTEKQREDLLFLLQHVPKGKIKVSVASYDERANFFGRRLVEIFEKAGFEVRVQQVNQTGGNYLLKGVTLAVAKIGKHPPHTVGIQRALTIVGIEAPVNGKDQPKLSEDTLECAVFPKP